MKKVFNLLILLVLIIVVCAFTVSAEAPSVDLDGIQIRLASGDAETGLRFIAKINGNPEDYTEYGMIVCPDIYYDTEHLTLENTVENGGNAIAIRSTDEDFVLFDSVENDHFRYTVCIIGIEHKNFERVYVARPYVIVNEGDAPIYGENYSEYKMSFFDFSEKVLEMYQDAYTSENAEAYTTLDDIVCGYRSYLNENTVEEHDYVSIDHSPINEWYFDFGTFSGSDGVPNPNNKKRVFTPELIPYDGETISVEKEDNSAIRIAVGFYDENGVFLSSLQNSWRAEASMSFDYMNSIKANTDADLSLAKYIRIAVYDSPSSDYTIDDIKDLGSRVKLTMPLRNVVTDDAAATWEHGTLSSYDASHNATRTGRITNTTYYPADKTEISFLGNVADGISCSYLVAEYDENKNFLQIGGFSSTAGTYKVKNENTAYLRIAMRKGDGNVAVADEEIALMASCMSIKNVLGNIKHSFFRLGDISSETGDVVASDSSVYSPAYLSTDVGFEFDNTRGYTYKLAYYDTDYGFISMSEELDAQINDIVIGEGVEGAVYYRPVVYLSGGLVFDVDYMADSFRFFDEHVISDSEWTAGYTINGTTGKITANSNGRMATENFYPIKDIRIRHSGATGTFGFFGYSEADENIAYLYKSGDISKVANVQPKVDALNDTASKYLRLYIKTQSSTIVPATETAFLDIRVRYGEYLELTTVSRRADMDIIKTEGLVARLSYSNVGSDTRYGAVSGFCDVEDEIWTYATSDTGTALNNDGYGTISRYKPSDDMTSLTYLGSFEHNFGHVNSMNYNHNTGAITFGNGSSAYTTTANYFYVYENIYDVVTGYTGEGIQRLELSDAICYEFDNDLYRQAAGTYMTKINSVFCSDNCLLLNANNNGFVFKVALGTGTRRLSKGTYIENCTESQYNGTYEFIRAYEMPDNHAIDRAPSYIGQNYAECNQGTEYHDGMLYLTCGHDGVYFWQCRLDSTDSDGDGLYDITRTWEYHKYYSTSDTGGMAGIIVTDDYLILGSGGKIGVFTGGADM